jgi:hypothetical protein
LEIPQEPFSISAARGYALWLSDLRPRTCLLVHWLFDLGAVPDPGEPVRHKARRFAAKRSLLGHIIEEYNGESRDKTDWLVQNGEFDIYVAWLMWLRFQEYIPNRFVTPLGRQNVLQWVRTQLRRVELTDEETLGELHWQIHRLRNSWESASDEPKSVAE